MNIEMMNRKKNREEDGCCVTMEQGYCQLPHESDFYTRDGHCQLPSCRQPLAFLLDRHQSFQSYGETVQA